MKKVLFTLLITIGVLSGKTQGVRSLWFNELIPNPGNGDNEYIEFYNSSKAPIPLDCYVVVSYFKSKQESGKNSEEGVYVYDFPGNAEIKGLSRYLISSANTINFKGSNNATTTYTPSDPTSFSNWNNSNPGGSLSKYVYDNGTWSSAQPAGADFNDFIYDANGTDATLMLFKIDNGVASFVNGFFANPQSSDVIAMISYLNNMSALPVIPVGNCGSSSVNINFSGITYNNVDVVAIKEAPGSGQGYAKKGDGLCGNWAKTSQGEYSPGTTNNFGTTTSSLNTSESFTCNTVNFSITTNNSPTYPILVQLFYDNPTASILEATDVYINQYSVGSSIQSSNSFNVPISNQPVLLAYQSSTGCFDKIISLSSSCSVLPVRFRSFTATRSKQKKELVMLNWETATEQNNRGFNVQRKISGEWKNIAFVSTKTSNGNSSSTQIYEYTDVNTLSSTTQYRLQQVDIDGKTSFSDVKTVMSTGENAGVVIYPNPGINGKINLQFKEPSTEKYVTVNDFNGRIIRQFPQVKNSILTIEGLPNGFYIIKVIDATTKAISIEKVLIQ